MRFGTPWHEAFVLSSHPIIPIGQAYLLMSDTEYSGSASEHSVFLGVVFRINTGGFDLAYMPDLA